MSEAMTLRPSRSRHGRAPRVAIVGAGQLARMTHQAAIALGVRVRVLALGDGDPAVRAGADHVVGTPERLGDLRALADGADVLTFDHERVPFEHLAALEREGVAVAPPAGAKRLGQDKLAARRVLSELGFPVPPFAHARGEEEVAAFARRVGWPLVGKTPRGGYDGRGVFALADAAAAREQLRRAPEGLVVEPRLRLERELAVLVARTAGGDALAYPVAETVQREAMCREVLAPAPIDPELAAEARRLSLALADAIGAVGVMSVELFATEEGLLVNELALRPHNAGHFTLGGCTTSQFEQHVRAVLGWPLGSTALVAPAVAMRNVVGPADGSDPASRVADALAVGGAQVHLYGKAPAAGRKLGHVTACGDTLAHARAVAGRAASLLEGVPA